MADQTLPHTLDTAAARWIAASRTYLNDRTPANCAALLTAFAAYQALTTCVLDGTL